MKNILIAILDGVMDASLAITMDTLITAQRLQDRSLNSPTVRICTVGYKKSIITGLGFRLRVDFTFAEISKIDFLPDWLIIPGAGLTSDTEIDRKICEPAVLRLSMLIKILDRSGVKIASSCSSVFLMADAGLLNGRKATTSWWLADLFRSRFPAVFLDDTKMLVRDGPYLSAGAAFAQLDLVLAIITEVMGHVIAHLCSRYLLIDKRISQARYMMQTHSSHSDPIVLRAELWIDTHLSEPINISRLANEMAVSNKTLARHILLATGQPTIKLIQRRRAIRASHLIETTSISLDAIASQVGYQDSTALRKILKREFGLTPSAMRYGSTD